MSETTFLQNDIVRRLTPGDVPSMVEGNLYRVISVVNEQGCFMECEGVPLYWGADRFELVYRPGDPESWKPKPGDPVRFTNPDHHDVTKVYYVAERDENRYMLPPNSIWVDLPRPAHDVATGWINGCGLVPMTHAEGFEKMGEELASVTEVATTPAEEPQDEKLTEALAEIERLKAENGTLSSLLTEEKGARWAVAKEYDAFREQVRDALIRESDDSGWSAEVDDVLEGLGLERRWSTYDLPTSLGSVVGLTDGRVAILEDDDWKGGDPWKAYIPESGDPEWMSYSEVNEIFSRHLYAGDGDDITDHC